MCESLKRVSCALVLLLLTGIAFAEVKEVKIAGDVKKGKALFNDTKLGGGTAGKSCNSCHPDGKGLENFIEQKVSDSTGSKLKSEEEAVNMCVKSPMKGVGMDIKGADMANVIAYIKSLKKPVEKSGKTEGKKIDKSQKAK
ncbi:MAG: hypothetical protein PHX78_08695 [bacterium]|nr:hypothetical protein [bacterium]